MLTQISSFSGSQGSLKRTHVFQPKYTKDSKYIRYSQGVTEFAEKHLFYLSYQITFVDEEINIALVKYGHSPRKPTRWVKEATALKCQLTDTLKEQKNSKNPSLKSEELKNICWKILDSLKDCPVKDTCDISITFIALMHEIEDKKLSYSKLLQSDDDIRDQDVEMKNVDASKPTAGCTKGDDTVTVENETEAVSFPESYPASTAELSSEDMFTSVDHSSAGTVEGSSTQTHDAVIPQISRDDPNPHNSEITEEVDAPDDVAAHMSRLLEQHESGFHRRQEKMSIPVSDPDGELASSSETVLEPETSVLTSEKNSSELQLQMSYSSPTREKEQHGGSVAGPAQTDESDLGIMIPISAISEMSMYVDLRLEILGTSFSQETLHWNISLGLDPNTDNYLFSSMKKLTEPEWDNHKTIVEGQQPSELPETTRADGAIVPENYIVLGSGCRSKEMLTVDEWRQAGVVNLMETNIILTEEPNCPNLVLLFLQRNNHLTCIPSSFFYRMPALRFLDLSNARIRDLPHSLFMLTKLQVLLLRSCVCLDSLPADVKNLKNMEVLDFSGTDLYYLPEETGELTRLRHLHLSFHRPDYASRYACFPSEMFSPSIISKLQDLQALSIVVHPEDQRWIKIEGEVVEHICTLKKLSYLQLYFLTVEALKSFVEVSPSWKEQKLWRFKFIVGRNIERLISRVPDEVEMEYDQQDRCLRFVNGKEVPGVVKTVLKPVTAFYLDHHLEIQSLSEFGISNFNKLKFCVVRECPNIQVMIIGEERTESDFPNLEHFGLHYLWELERIWEDPVPPGSFKALKYLRVNTCRKLRYIASHSMLQRLSNLETFIVEDCESLESIVKENEMVKYDGALLPRLTTLVLRHLPRLVTLGSGLRPSKEKISIHCCPRLILTPYFRRLKLRKLQGSSYLQKFYSTVCFSFLKSVNFTAVDSSKRYESLDPSRTQGS